MRTEATLTKNRIIAELAKAPHGKLEEYVPIGRQAVALDEDFYGHLIAWSAEHSEVRDTRVALPVIGLAGASPLTHPLLLENAVAHVAALDPRSFGRAMDFANTLTPRRSKLYRRLVARYLQNLEKVDVRKWEHVTLQHRASLKRLYAFYHVKPSDLANRVILRGEAPAGTVFEVVRNLSNMTPAEAAGQIVKRQIPFLIAAGALGDKMKSVDVVLALIKAMTPTELVTNTKRLEKLGVRKEPALRAAFEEALEKAASGKKKARTSLKAGQAAAAVKAVDTVLGDKLEKLQQQMAERISVEGNWLVLGDKSASMQVAIATSIEIAGTLAGLVKGQVHLVFFDSMPTGHDVTGLSLADIKQKFATLSAGGNTHMGAALVWAMDRKLDIDGIVVVSDGGENARPAFAEVYAHYAKQLDKQVPVYLYLLKGDQNVMTGNCATMGIGVQEFDLRAGADYTSLPNLAKTMRSNRYSLIDEIMAMPLKVLNDVLTLTTDMEVISRARTTQEV